MSEKKNGNGKKSRSSGSTTIVGFGKVVVGVRLYPTAKDRDDRASFHQYHAKDMGRARAKLVCEICNEDIQRGSGDVVKGKEYGDQIIPFTDAELEGIRKSKSNKISLEYFVDSKQFTPAMLGKSFYAGTSKDGGAQPFKFLHTVMQERPNLAAKVHWVNSQGHDVHGIMRTFENGFLVQEITPEYLFKPFSSVEIADAEVPVKLIEKGVAILDGMKREKFEHAEVVDAYPEAVEKLTNAKVMGEPIPVEEIKQENETSDLEAMLE